MAVRDNDTVASCRGLTANRNLNITRVIHVRERIPGKHLNA